MPSAFLSSTALAIDCHSHTASHYAASRLRCRILYDNNARQIKAMSKLVGFPAESLKPPHVVVASDSTDTKGPC